MSNLKLIEKVLVDGVSDYFSMMTREGKLVSELNASITALFPLYTPNFDETKYVLAGNVEWEFKMTNSEPNNDLIPTILKGQPAENVFPYSEIEKLTQIAKQVEIQAKLTFTLQTSEVIKETFEFCIKV